MYVNISGMLKYIDHFQILLSGIELWGIPFLTQNQPNWNIHVCTFNLYYRTCTFS